MGWDRDVVLDELEMGFAGREIARRLGINRATVSRWCWQAGLRMGRGRNGGRGVPVMPEEFVDGHPRPARAGHGRRLDHTERVFIQIRLADGWSYQRIAGQLGVAASTVSREVRRGCLLPDGGYSARRSSQRCARLRSRSCPGKLETNKALRRQVVEWLNMRFSPRQIQHRLVVEYPEEVQMRVSAETIYQALYVQGRGSLREELRVQKALRSGRQARKPRSQLPASLRSWVRGYELSKRPPQVQDRAVPGHWEGDLVIGANHQSALITLVERSTRYTLVRKVPGHFTALSIADELIDMMSQLPDKLRQSLTWDRGPEMAQHPRFTLATGTKVYFADPHCPWQRGTNENTNGLIRDFYPKGTDFQDVTDEEIAQMEYLLNIRPRQTLNWLNPTEKLAVALTT